MKKKKNFSVAVIVCLSLCLIVGAGLCVLFSYSEDIRSQKYIKKIHNQSLNQPFLVSSVFDFEFDRAYLIKDAYLDGDGICQEYGLDLSISDVQSKEQEYIQRIIFVNEKGQLLYEFRYDVADMYIEQNNLIFYPDTKMERYASGYYNKFCEIKFLDIPPENYLKKRDGSPPVNY